MSEQDYFFAAEGQLPKDDPASEPELTPEQEKEYDHLVEQGVHNPLAARAKVLGLPLPRSLGETFVRAATVDTGSDTVLPPTQRSTGSRRKMSPRKRAWGDQASAEDGTYHPLN